MGDHVGDGVDSMADAEFQAAIKEAPNARSLTREQVQARVEMEVPLGINSFSRDFEIKPSFLTWCCVELRLKKGNALAGAVIKEGIGFVVKSQVVELHRKLRFSYPELFRRPFLRIVQQVVHVGTSSFDYNYEIYLCHPGGGGGGDPPAPERIATIEAKMVCVRSKRKVDMPFRLPFKLDAPGTSLTSTFRDAVGPRLPATDLATPVFEHEVLIRYQDEDPNHHTNHASYFRFFEDAYRTMHGNARAQIEKIGVEYVRETCAGQHCTVRVTRGAAPNALLLFLITPDGEVATRAWVQSREPASHL